MTTRLVTLASLLALVILPFAAHAQLEGTSYNIKPGSETGSSGHRLSSTSGELILNGSISPISGSGSGSSYSIQSGSASGAFCGDGFIDSGESCDGADLDSETCVTRGFTSGTLNCSSTCAFDTTLCTSGSAPTGGGGGARSAIPDPPSISSELDDTLFTYRSEFLLYGTYPYQATSVEVNGNTEGVTLSFNKNWKIMLLLAYGDNTFDVTASNDRGTSGESSYALYRRIVGDVNQDNVVNDYDLSGLVRAWGSDDRTGDFNEDGTVDDYDFSMMVSRWGAKL